MIASGRPGSVINLISTAGHQGEPDNIGYTTAKGGLLNMTRSAAVELAPFGIRVNSLTPTATDPSEMFERARRWGREMRGAEKVAALMEPFRRGAPMQRLPKPSDYGLAAAFLVSDDAAMITGTDLRVDAGAVARYWAWDPAGLGKEP
jgi:NAD(P)-dependent dehydrogenase (short-subunit alcohol dehydrogenase family)